MNKCLAYDDGRNMCWMKNGEADHSCGSNPGHCPLAPRVLHFTLKREWFYRHLEDKPEDYRGITAYWVVRLFQLIGGGKIPAHMAYWYAIWLQRGLSMKALGIEPRIFDLAQARAGYAADAPTWRKKFITTSIGIGNPAWGAPSHPVFIIELGEIIETKNINSSRA